MVSIEQVKAYTIVIISAFTLFHAFKEKNDYSYGRGQ